MVSAAVQTHTHAHIHTYTTRRRVKKARQINTERVAHWYVDQMIGGIAARELFLLRFHLLHLLVCSLMRVLGGTNRGGGGGGLCINNQQTQTHDDEDWDRPILENDKSRLHLHPPPTPTPTSTLSRGNFQSNHTKLSPTDRKGEGEGPFHYFVCTLGRLTSRCVFGTCTWRHTAVNKPSGDSARPPSIANRRPA